MVRFLCYPFLCDPFLILHFPPIIFIFALVHSTNNMTLSSIVHYRNICAFSETSCGEIKRVQEQRP